MPLHAPYKFYNDDGDDDVTRRNTFDCWAEWFNSAGPWPSNRGGSTRYGGASSSPGFECWLDLLPVI